MSDFLVIQAARFGDLLQTKRLLLSLREMGQVHLAIDKGLASLASIIYPFATLHPLEFHSAPNTDALRYNMAAFGALREVGFSKIFNCNYSLLATAVCRLFPPDKVVGNRPAHDFDGGIERSPWARLVSRLSGMRQATPLNLVDFWAYFTKAPISPGQVNPPAKAGGGGLGIVVAGRQARRSLPAPIYASIAEVAFKFLKGAKVKVFGGQGEVQAARKLVRNFGTHMQAKTENLCGRTDWQALCEQLGGLDLLLTPDTGVMHLAAHFGVPIMAFFLSSAQCHETGPYGEGHVIWQTALPCSPCLESAPCPHNTACLGPFADSGFGRAIATALAGSPNLPPLPVGMQGWRSALDDFGAHYQLLAGEDKSADKRQNLRALVRDFVGLPAMVNPAGAPQSAYANLVAALFPDDEWALPPWRYD